MTCDIKEQKTDYYIHEKDELADFKVDQTVLLKEKYLKNVCHLYTKEKQHEVSSLDKWYPFVNSYYPYTEDVDAFARVNHLLDTKPSFASISSAECGSDIPEKPPYSEASAQVQYLESNPLSFIILGKPGIGEEELGKLLADYWHCVYIDPEILIEEEICSGSRAGQCIEFNLRCGRAIGIDVILRLVEKKVKSESARHRGFVICGLPLIPNDLYEEDPISSESAVFNVKEIFEDVFDTVIEIGVPPSKPHVSISSKYQSRNEENADEEDEKKELGNEEEAEEAEEEEEAQEISLPKVVPEKSSESETPVDVGTEFNLCGPPEIAKNYEEQLNFIFQLIKAPFLLIYMMCSSIDVIKKRENYRFDVYSKQVVNLQTETCNKLLFNYFSQQDINHEDRPEEFFEMNYIDLDNSNFMDLVRLPRHFPANVSTQLDSYHYTALNFIERRVLMHDPQYFLKVDGRTNVHRMLHIIKSRLAVLPVQKVLIPAKLNTGEVADAGEGGPLPYDIQNKSFEECYREFCKRQVPSDIYKWRWSDWGTKCPVAMKDGVVKDGDPKWAVQFMNRMFFLADQEAFYKFYCNPRPYLLPPNPRPYHKIFIFGPKSSGKSAIAKCLSYYFDATILSITDMMDVFVSQTQGEYKEKIRQAAIAEAMQILNETRIREAEVLEQQRIENIQQWMATVIQFITDLITLLNKELEPVPQTLELSSFPMAMQKKGEGNELENEITIAINKIREELEKFEIPFHKNIPDWEDLLKNKRNIVRYLPSEWKSKVVPKPATVFDEFVIEYADNAVAKAVFDFSNMDAKKMVDIFLNSIKTIEETSQERGVHKGWIIDGMLCDIDFIKALYPDYIANEILIFHDKDNFEFLVNRYKIRGENRFWEYRQFFLDIGKVDAAWRCPSVVSTKSFKNMLVRDILSEIFGNDNIFGDDETSSGNYRTETYRQDLIKFYKNWDTINDFFLENKIQPLEIVVTDKSLPELMKEVIRVIENKYRLTASVFNEEDRAEEVKNLGNQIAHKDIGEGVPTSRNVFEKNRRYGDTYHYCPVAFHEKGVLWKGKEDFSVKFEDKIYLMNNKADMNKFLLTPRDYLTEKPPEKFPSPRICVIGVPGIGKTYLAKIIADNFGLSYVSFESLLKEFFNISSSESLNELRRKKVEDEKLKLKSKVKYKVNISNYLNDNEPLPDEFFETLLYKVWFERQTLGFVLDDFPKRPSDIDSMARHKLIPDAIIYLTISGNQIVNVLLERCLSRWVAEAQEQRNLQNERNKNNITEWEESRRRRYDELIEERRERRYAKKRKENAASRSKSPMEDRKEADELTKRLGFRAVSQVSFDSIAEQEDIDEVTRILDIELPEIVIVDPLKDLPAQKEKFENLISETTNRESRFISDIKKKCEVELIMFQEVTSDFDYSDLTVRTAFAIVDVFKYRTKSHFESCYDISMEVADRLLSCGYYFLSKFGKTCPVQYYENKNPFQMYLVMEKMYGVFPVIHRSFIYYIVGKDNLNRFKEDPLKFTEVENFNFPMLPFRVAITGPPKSGKTVLSDRLKSEFGFKIISRGQAARYVLRYLPLSNLAVNMESVLRKGWELTDEMVAKCVEAASIDGRAVTQGIVYDGFPNTIPEVKHLSYVGLIPNLVVDLQATQPEMFECLSNDVGRRGFPRYSKVFLEHLLTEWSKYSEEFRRWIDREYQVRAKISISTCKWSVWSQTRAFVFAVFFEIKHYHIHIHDDWPLRLANMLVTPLEFLERQSSYKTFCPCCLHFSKTLTSGGDPPDRTGLVQFRKHLYWLCDEHIEQFLKIPEAYLPPFNKNALPQQIPTVVYLEAEPTNVFEDGACAVCYVSKRIIVKGSITTAVSYNYHVYFFDTEDCLKEFMKQPQNFTCEIDFRPPTNYPALRYQELPILGMLEQYVAGSITKGLSFISRRRPIIPGLGIKASAAIGLGLYLKTHNDNIFEEYKPCYKNADRLFHERRKKLIQYLERMKTCLNPYLHYEEPMPQFLLPPSIGTPSTESITTTMYKLVDEIIDNADYDTDT